MLINDYATQENLVAEVFQEIVATNDAVESSASPLSNTDSENVPETVPDVACIQAFMSQILVQIHALNGVAIVALIYVERLLERVRFTSLFCALQTKYTNITYIYIGS